MASVNLSGLQDLVKLKDQIQPTSNQNFACTSVPSHWRCGKALPDPFRVFALMPVPDQTEVTCVAYNDECPVVEMKGNAALMVKGVATFDELRFLGRSGRGKVFHMKVVINTTPRQEAVLYDTIKITVDGPREPRKRKPSTSESRRDLYDLSGDDTKQSFDMSPQKAVSDCMNSPLPSSPASGKVRVKNKPTVAPYSRAQSMPHGSDVPDHPTLAAPSSLGSFGSFDDIRSQQLARLSLTSPDNLSYGIAGFVPNLSNTASEAMSMGASSSLARPHLGVHNPMFGTAPLGHWPPPLPAALNPFYGNIASMGDGYMGSPNVAYAAAAQLRNPMSTMTAGRKTLQTIRPSEAVVSNEFQFEMLSPSEGSEGDMITAVLRLSPGILQSRMNDLKFCILVGTTTPKLEETDLQGDGQLYCRFRAPSGLDVAKFEALALLRLPNGTVYCTPKSQMFTFSVPEPEVKKEDAAAATEALTAAQVLRLWDEFQQLYKSRGTGFASFQTKLKAYDKVMASDASVDALIQECEGKPLNALHIAASFGWQQSARKLTERGVDVCGRDTEGRTAVECARQAGHSDLAEYLQHVADLAMLNKSLKGTSGGLDVSAKAMLDALGDTQLMDKNVADSESGAGGLVTLKTDNGE